jgi:hypothetical protein
MLFGRKKIHFFSRLSSQMLYLQNFAQDIKMTATHLAVIVRYAYSNTQPLAIAQ